MGRCFPFIMSQERCLSFESLMDDVQSTPSPKTIGVELLERGISLDTIQDLCKRLFETGDKDLARTIFGSEEFKASVVVPTSRKLEDGTYALNEIPDQKLSASDHLFAMSYLE